MDPVLFKFIQLILAELLGATLCLFGVYLFLKGVSGKSNLLVKGAGLTAKLTNGAPGSIIAIVGAIIIAISLNSSVERIVKIDSRDATLRLWLEKSDQINDKMNYAQVIDKIIGTEKNKRFINKTITLKSSSTLSKISQQEYSNQEYWRLLAAINKDRGYFTFEMAKSDTIIPEGSVLEAWHISQYDNMSVETRVKVSAENRLAAYDEMLKRAESGEEFDFVKLSDEFSARELGLAWSVAQLDRISNLRELSLKYYGDPKYWKIINWSNKEVFASGATDRSEIPPDKEIHIAHFLGWPR